MCQTRAECIQEPTAELTVWLRTHAASSSVEAHGAGGAWLTTGGDRSDGGRPAVSARAPAGRIIGSPWVGRSNRNAPDFATANTRAPQQQTDVLSCGDIIIDAHSQTTASLERSQVCLFQISSVNNQTLHKSPSQSARTLAKSNKIFGSRLY